MHNGLLWVSAPIQAERKNTSMVNTTTMEMSNGNVESLKFAPWSS